MKISDNQIQGNRAEQFVSYLLSNYCLVRPVVGGTDIGIDLYCESLFENKPNLHFWIQVKSSTTEKIKINKDKASFIFKVKHLKYWNNQPVPVYAFLIKNNDNVSLENYSIYVVNITEQMLNGIPNQVTKTLWSDFTINNNDDLIKFISQNVEITAARQQLNNGVIAPINSTKDKYVKRVFPDDSSAFSKQILWSIRVTAGSLIGDILKKENDQPNRKEFKSTRRILTSILETFKDKKNWDVPYYLGMSYKQDNKLTNARRQLERALKLIEEDPNINQDQWNKQKDEIKRIINKMIINSQ